MRPLLRWPCCGDGALRVLALLLLLPPPAAHAPQPHGLAVPLAGLLLLQRATLYTPKEGGF